MWERCSAARWSSSATSSGSIVRWPGPVGSARRTWPAARGPPSGTCASGRAHKRHAATCCTTVPAGSCSPMSTPSHSPMRPAQPASSVPSRSPSDRSTPPTRSRSGSGPGTGFSWGDHDGHVLGGCERFFRPGYLNNLASAWIPALDGVEAKLTAGARVADVGCGHGASTLLLAEEYPASSIVGFDAHEGSIESARKRAADAGLADRVRFEVASAATFEGAFDLVCFFDCLHDMGDPAGACAHARDRLAPGRDPHAHRAVRPR